MNTDEDTSRNAGRAIRRSRGFAKLQEPVVRGVHSCATLKAAFERFASSCFLFAIAAPPLARLSARKAASETTIGGHWAVVGDDRGINGAFPQQKVTFMTTRRAANGNLGRTLRDRASISRESRDTRLPRNPRDSLLGKMNNFANRFVESFRHLRRSKIQIRTWIDGRRLGEDASATFLE